MYSKIFSQIFESSVADNYTVRHVFMDLLVLADRDGIVDMTPEAISRRTSVPLDVLMPALAALGAPDPRSRASTHQGRRIVPVDPDRGWGWRIVNFRAYHQLRNENARRAKNRRYQQDHRRRARESKAAQDLSAPVSTCQHLSGS